MKSNSFNFERVSRPDPRVQAGIEWLALSFVAVFLMKPYFEGFMNEAGKDHYHALKQALRSLWQKLFSEDCDFRVVKMTASGEQKTKYSMLFAVYAPVEDGHLLKLLIREDCSIEEFSESLELFLKVVDTYHSQEREVTSKVDLEDERVSDSITLLEYDSEDRRLRIVDPRPSTKGRKKSSDD